MLMRQQLTNSLRDAGRCTVRRGDHTWVIDQGRLVDASVAGSAGRALPIDPPPPPEPGRPLTRHHVDEALVLAKYVDRYSARIEIVECEGDWRFPVEASDELPRLGRVANERAA